MGWSSDFLDELSRRTVSPKWRLDFVADWHDKLSATYSCGSHSTPVKLGASIRVGGERLTPGSWRYTAGQWSVELVGDLSDLFEAGIERGHYAVLSCGFAGWAEEDFEPVALGALRSINGVAPSYVAVFDSLFAHWSTRHDTSSSNMALFDVLDLDDAARTRNSTSVTADYTAGDGGTLTVTSTTSKGFEVGDSKGAVELEDTTQGDAFYATFTGVTATTLTGLSTGDILLTTQTDLLAATPAKAYPCAYLDGHPFDFARQVLVSTGDATNGDHDVLPETWGFAALDDWLDHDDIDAWKDVVGNKSGTDHDWAVVVEEGKTAAISWLQTLLAEAGIWLVGRQGQVSIRAAQNPDATDANRYEDALHSGVAITDDDIEEVLDHHHWSTEVAVESTQCVVWYVHGDSSPSAPDSVSVADTYTSTLPARTSAEHDLTAWVFQSSDNPAKDVAYRCYTWECRVPEYVKVRCRGLRLAQLVAGDLATLSTSRLRGRLEQTVAGFSEVDVMVIGKQEGWMDSEVVLELMVPALKTAT